MKTYKQSVLLAGVSTASATKQSLSAIQGHFDNIQDHFGDEYFDDFFGPDGFLIPQYQDEGEECRLWWNTREFHLECREGLECRDQGAESIDGIGICDDPQKLGEFFDECDGWDEDGNRIPGCADEFECRDSYWFTSFFGKVCMNRRTRVGWQEQCGYDEQTGLTYPECKSGLACQPADRDWDSRNVNVCLDETVGIGETCEGWDESTGKPYPRCDDGLVCDHRGPDFDSLPGMENTCQLASPRGPYESCNDDSECQAGLMCTFDYDAVFIDVYPYEPPGLQCLHILAQEGDYCGEHELYDPQPDCDVGLECREYFYEGLGFSVNKCQRSEPLGELNDVCLGFNEDTAEPFADCREGLVCLPTPPFGMSIPGAGQTCQEPMSGNFWF